MPKARPKGVVDGEQVNIPVPPVNAMGGRRKVEQPAIGCAGSSFRWGFQANPKSR